MPHTGWYSRGVMNVGGAIRERVWNTSLRMTVAITDVESGAWLTVHGRAQGGTDRLGQDTTSSRHLGCALLAGVLDPRRRDPMQGLGDPK